MCSNGDGQAEQQVGDRSHGGRDEGGDQKSLRRVSPRRTQALAAVHVPKTIPLLGCFEDTIFD
jgi:hypothetical protein